MALSNSLWFEHAWLPDGWARDVLVEVLDDGRIGAVRADVAQPNTGVVRLNHALLPAMANLHSHAHQRAMAGLTERRGPTDDSFWTWRALMYRLLSDIQPHHLEAIAALVYKEMLEAGYATVGEFHYLHHTANGAPFSNPAEMCERIASAAQSAGIGLTLLPVRYASGGIDGRPIQGAQARFATRLDQYERLMSGALQAVGKLGGDSTLGIAPHSLRAVPPDELRATLAVGASGPVHIHIAEQQAEVDEVVAHTGARPVRWLLDEVGVNANWCLVHATHLDEVETQMLARSGAVAGLCPITEANLGDGIFNGVAFRELSGVYGVGSDSNVNISLSEELRTLEYSQRLKSEGRALMAAPESSVGQTLYGDALVGGAKALGRHSGAIEPGRWADLTSLDLRALTFAGASIEQTLDAWIFAGSDAGVVSDVWSAGRHQVIDGVHVNAQEIEANYRTAMSDLFQ